MDGEWAPPLIDNPVCKTAPGCGPWTQPLIPNPKFKGKWKAPLIDNPDFQGKWTPKKIPNPNYFFDDTPLKSSPIVSTRMNLNKKVVKQSFWLIIQCSS